MQGRDQKKSTTITTSGIARTRQFAQPDNIPIKAKQSKQSIITTQPQQSLLLKNKSNIKIANSQDVSYSNSISISSPAYNNIIPYEQQLKSQFESSCILQGYSISTQKQQVPLGQSSTINILKEQQPNLKMVEQAKHPGNTFQKLQIQDQKKVLQKQTSIDTGSFEQSLLSLEKIIRPSERKQKSIQEMQGENRQPSGIRSSIDYSNSKTAMFISGSKGQQNRRHQRHNSEIAFSSTSIAQTFGSTLKTGQQMNKENNQIILPTEARNVNKQSQQAVIMNQSQLLPNNQIITEKQIKQYNDGYYTLPQNHLSSQSSIINCSDEISIKHKDKFSSKPNHQRQNSASTIHSQSGLSSSQLNWKNPLEVQGASSRSRPERQLPVESMNPSAGIEKKVHQIQANFNEDSNFNRIEGMNNNQYNQFNKVSYQTTGSKQTYLPNQSQNYYEISSSSARNQHQNQQMSLENKIREKFNNIPDSSEHSNHLFYQNKSQSPGRINIRPQTVQQLQKPQDLPNLDNRNLTTTQQTFSQHLRIEKEKSTRIQELPSSSETYKLGQIQTTLSLKQKQEQIPKEVGYLSGNNTKSSSSLQQKSNIIKQLNQIPNQINSISGSNFISGSQNQNNFESSTLLNLIQNISTISQSHILSNSQKNHHRNQSNQVSQASSSNNVKLNSQDNQIQCPLENSNHPFQFDFGDSQKYNTLQHSRINEDISSIQTINKIHEPNISKLRPASQQHKEHQDSVFSSTSQTQSIFMNPSSDLTNQPQSTKSQHFSKSRTASIHFHAPNQQSVDLNVFPEKFIKPEDPNNHLNKIQPHTNTRQTSIVLSKLNKDFDNLKQNSSNLLINSNLEKGIQSEVNKQKSDPPASQVDGILSQQSKNGVIKPIEVTNLNLFESEIEKGKACHNQFQQNQIVSYQDQKQEEALIYKPKLQRQNQNLQNVLPRRNSEIAPIFFADYDDLAKYFTQNNGQKPSNNTPVQIHQKIEFLQSIPVVENFESVAFDPSLQPIKKSKIVDNKEPAIKNSEPFSVTEQDSQQNKNTNEKQFFEFETQKPFQLKEKEQIFQNKQIQDLIKGRNNQQDFVIIDKVENDFDDLVCDEYNLFDSKKIEDDFDNCQNNEFKTDNTNINIIQKHNLASNYVNLDQFSDTLPSFSNNVSAVIEDQSQPEEDMQTLLNNFEKTHIQYPIFGSEHLEFLVLRDCEYAPDPHYLNDQKQPNLSVNMRATLLDWMMEVSEEFRMKRETFHIAVNLVDRYLSLNLNIKKRDFQLIGVTSLYIAAKLEEIMPPRISDFVCSTNSGYTAVEINQTELNILEVLKFKINPPTVNMWSNWFMSQWDIFIQTSQEAQESHIVQIFVEKNQRLVQFKQPDEESYSLFREFMQVVDFSILDISTLQHEPRQVLASIMYITVAKGLDLFNDEYIQQINHGGIGEFEGRLEFNSLFDSFVNLSFGFPLFTIYPIIQGIAFYFSLPKDTHIPSAAANQDSDSPFQGYYEDFLAFQTHNKDQLSILQSKI